MEYVVDCECSEEIGVELYQAGTAVSCPVCQASVPVPSSDKLKVRAGDLHPFASALKKAEIAIKQRQPPFDGVCQSCGQEQATIQQFVHFRFLAEREFENNGGLQVNGIGRVVLARNSATREQWDRLDFPLLFCTPCYQDFRSFSKRARLLSLPFKLIAFASLAALGVLLIGLSFALPFVGIPLTFFVFWRIFDALRRQRGDATLRAFVSELQWIGDVVKREEESELILGRATYIAEGGHTVNGDVNPKG